MLHTRVVEMKMRNLLVGFIIIVYYAKIAADKNMYNKISLRVPVFLSL